MKTIQRLTAIIMRDDDGYVASCAEHDIASQGSSIEGARENLVEALALFFETASPSEIARRSQYDVFVTHIDVPIPVSENLSDRNHRASE